MPSAAEIAFAIRATNEAKQVIDGVRAQVQDLGKAAGDAHAPISGIGDRLGGLGDKAGAVGTPLSTLHGQLGTLGEKVGALGSPLTAVHGQLGALGDKATATGAPLTGLQGHLATLTEKAGAGGTPLTGLGGHIVGMGEKATAAGGPLTGLHGHLSSVAEKAGSTGAPLSGLGGHIVSVGEKAGSASGPLGTLDGTIGKLGDKATGATAPLTGLQGHLQVTGDKATAATTPVTGLHGHVATLGDKAGSAGTPLATLHGHLATVGEKSGAASAPLSVLHGNIGTLGDKATTSSGPLAVLHGHLGAVSDKATGAGNPLTGLSGHLGAVTDKATGANTPLSTLHGHIAQAGDKSTNSAAPLAALHGHIGTLGEKSETASGPLAKLHGHLSTLGKNATNASGPIGGLATSLGSMALAASGAGAVMGAGLGIGDAIGKTKDLENQVNKLRREFGGTAEDASRLAFAFHETGVSFEAGEKGVGKFSKALAVLNDSELNAMQKEAKKAVDSIAKLGITMVDQEGNTKELGALHEELAAHFGHKTPAAVAQTEKAFASLSNAYDVLDTQGVLAVSGSAELVKNLQYLGVETQDATGKTVPMNTILAELSGKFKAMPDGFEKTAISMQLFGKGGKDLIPFLNKGTEGIEEFYKASDKLGMTLSTSTVNAMEKGKGVSREFHAAISGIEIQIGTALMPVLLKLATIGTELALKWNEVLVPAIKVAGAWVRENLIPILSQLVTGLLDLIHHGAELAESLAGRLLPPLKALFGYVMEHKDILGAIGITIAVILVPALVGFTLATVAATVALAAQAVAMALAYAPVTLLIAGIGLLVYGIIELVKHWDDAVKAVPQLGVALDIVKKVAADLSGWFNDTLLPALRELWQWFGVNLPIALAKVSAFVKTDLLPAIVDLGAWIKGTLIPTLKEIADWFSIHVHAAFLKVSTFIKSDVMPVIRELSDWFNVQVLPTLKTLATFIQTDLLPALRAVGEVVGTQVLASLKLFVRFVADELLPAAKSAFGGALSAVQALVTWVTDHWGDIKAAIIPVLTVIAAAVVTAFETIQITITTIIYAVRDVLNIAMALIHGDFKLAWENVKKLFADIWEGIHRELKIAAALAGTILGAAWTEIGIAAGIAWGLFKTAIGTVWSGITAGIATAIEGIKTLLSTAWNDVRTAAGTIWTDIVTLVTGKAQEIWNWIDKNFVGQIAKALKSPFEAFRDTVGDIMKGAANNFLAPLRGALAGFGLFIDGVRGAVNWVAGKVGLGDIIPGGWSAPAIPALAVGSANFPGGMALVGEKGPELVKLPANSAVFTAEQTQKMLADQLGTGGFPGLGDIGSIFKNAASGIMDFAKEWIAKGASALVDKALDMFGIKGLDLPGVFKDVAGKLFGSLKDAIIEGVKEMLTGAKNAIAAQTAAATSSFSGGGGGGQLQRPVGGYQVSQEFGPASGDNGYFFHTGIDLAVGQGTPVGAAGAGRVAGYAGGGYGQYAPVMDHGGGLQTIYGHLSALTASMGTVVKQLEQIGLSGGANRGIEGNTTGPHLHFEVRQDGAPQNPRNYVQLAQGGIVNRPTMAMIGESGAEAVIPLPAGYSPGRGRSSGFGGGNTTINVTVNALDVSGMREAIPEIVRQIDLHLKQVGQMGLVA